MRGMRGGRWENDRALRLWSCLRWRWALEKAVQLLKKDAEEKKMVDYDNYST